MPLVVAGDFNNSAIWDRPGNMNNMVAIDAALGELGLASAYHIAMNRSLGNEDHATLYWRDRKKNGYRYHIDYIYLPTSWFDRSVQFSIGEFDDFVANKLSDHVPLSVAISID
jgi:endonuclease/exonuclease/phosphatase family metal-dependent hydrolase